MIDEGRPWRRDPALSAMLAYWRSKCGAGKLPARGDIDPLELDARLLPHTVLTELVREDGRRRFRFRLAGTAVSAAAGLELTGQFVDALNPNRRYADYIAGLYGMAIETARPVYSESQAVAARSDAIRQTRRLICPLASDGATVDMFLCAQTFDDQGMAKAPTLTYADTFRPGPTIVVADDD